MNRLYPGHRRRGQRLEAVLIIISGSLVIVGTFLNAYPLPFRVPRVLVLLPAVSGFALALVALVLILRELPLLPWR